MPFFQPSKEVNNQIDLNRYNPVPVFFCTFADGKLQPMRFKYELPDCTIETINIDGIKSTKDIKGGVSFCCVATLYGRQQQFILAYFYKEHLWCIDKA